MRVGYCLKSFLCDISVLSFVSMIVFYMEAKEACIEEKEACVEEGTCMKCNRLLSRSLERWEKEPGRLSCCFIYTPVSTVS